MIGGVLATLVAFGGGHAVGSISGFEAVRLLEASLPTARFLASGVMAVAATILALMLTLLSLSYGTDFRLRTVHYRRIKMIALVDTVGFVVSTVFLLLLIIPLEQTENIDVGWYGEIYYAVLGISAVMGGLLITVVLMLYHTVRDVIDTIAGDDSGPLVADDDQDTQGSEVV